MAKTMKSYRFSDRTITYLQYLSDESGMTETEVIENLILDTYTDVKYGNGNGLVTSLVATRITSNEKKDTP